ncbi:MAG: 4-amino-4-deoxy-L-arabinose-phosphoundecaprenol flippase subunit ArnE [Sodalis sp.]|nr:MAG: 4-amino-4-deoxy-L-arabinose-phosphoundecaprenol flippase subunit ArnE [Sodalis sp.]
MKLFVADDWCYCHTINTGHDLSTGFPRLATSVLLLDVVMLVWLWVLQWMPVGIAYPMFSLNLAGPWPPVCCGESQ